MGKPALYTIGYEGASQGDFWATLLASGIKTIIDVRDVPFSRKPGFSKKALGHDAGSFDLNYVHLAGLGDPKEGRDAAKAGKHALFLEIFSARMKTPLALSDLAEAVGLSLGAPSCLLCYERNPEYCHRSIVASHIIGQESFQLFHLGVRVGLALNSPRVRGRHGPGDFVLGGS